MRVSCQQESLSKGLTIVGRAAAVRSTLPITSHVLLATDGARLKLSATNLEIAVTCWVEAQVTEEGALAVPSRLLSEYVNSLPNETVEMSFAQRARQLRVACARNEATVAGMDSEDFPPIPVVADGVSVKLEPVALRRAISQVEFAAANDDTRPVLTGVHALLEGRELTLAAADGFRLAVHKLALDEEVERTEVIIPARALRELHRLLGDEEEPVEFAINESRSRVLFRLSNVEVVSQLIQGTFPNYAQLIPQSYTCRAVMAVADFLRETRIAAIFARDGSGIIRIQILPGKVVVSARSEEVGDNRGEADAQVDGEEAKVAFNSRYLQEVLQVLDSRQVALEVTTPSSPGVLRPVGAENYVHVVMPMFVQW